MPMANSKALFTDLSTQESANINGAWGRDYYYAPVYYCYPASSGWNGNNQGNNGGSTAVNQTVNVNVLIDD